MQSLVFDYGGPVKKNLLDGYEISKKTTQKTGAINLKD